MAGNVPRLRVLVIEDELLTRWSIAETLSQMTARGTPEVAKGALSVDLRSEPAADSWRTDGERLKGISGLIDRHLPAARSRVRSPRLASAMNDRPDMRTPAHANCNFNPAANSDLCPVRSTSSAAATS